MTSAAEPGRVVGGVWRLDRLLGQGGQGRVWSARHLKDGRREVLKQLSGRLEGPARQRFEREAALLRRLRHPHLVPALELIEASDGLFIRMAWAPGVDLRERLKARSARGEAFELHQVESFVAMACDVLGYCHAESVVHRDLKPGNVRVVEENGELRHLTLLDFGVAHWPGTEASAATTAGRVLGSHRYGSPEQLRGEPAGPEADLFALAALVWEMLSLRRAWLRREDDTPCRWHEAMPAAPNERSEVVRRILEGRWVPLGCLDPGLAGFDGFFARAFAPVGSDRFPSAEAFRTGFDAAAREVSGVPEAGPTGGWTWVSPRPLDPGEQPSTVAGEAEAETRLAPLKAPAVRSTPPRPRPGSRRRPPGPIPSGGPRDWLSWAGSPWVTLAFVLAAAILSGLYLARPAAPPDETVRAPAPQARPR